MNDKTFQVYVTKYALTNGIEKKTVRETHTPTMVVEAESPYASSYHGEGKDWHRSLESAEKRAIKMRDAKIAALQKQITKLKAMSFTSIN